MLRFDLIGARAIWDRSQDRLDETYLLRRILEEELERRASFVRFFDVLPGIPKTDFALDRARLERKLRKHAAARTPPSVKTSSRMRSAQSACGCVLRSASRSSW